jgi:hypothetical protein
MHMLLQMRGLSSLGGFKLCWGHLLLLLPLGVVVAGVSSSSSSRSSGTDWQGMQQQQQ